MLYVTAGEMFQPAYVHALAAYPPSLPLQPEAFWPFYEILVPGGATVSFAIRYWQRFSRSLLMPLRTRHTQFSIQLFFSTLTTFRPSQPFNLGLSHFTAWFACPTACCPSARWTVSGPLFCGAGDVRESFWCFFFAILLVRPGTLRCAVPVATPLVNHMLGEKNFLHLKRDSLVCNFCWFFFFACYVR